MITPTQSNPNDYKVVSFHNSTDFGFTPEMGCMYNGMPINGKSGFGIEAGETMIVPFHIGNQLALNLAKAKLNRAAPATDPSGIPTGVPLWSPESLESVRRGFLKELYTEERPAPKTETDLLLQRLEEYRRMTEEKFAELAGQPVQTAAAPEKIEETAPAASYKDKAEVLAELEKRGIKHDKRSSKETLEKLLA